MIRSTISRLLRFFFVPPVHHATPPKASNCVPLHTVYTYLTGLLLALVEIKYEGCSSSLFKEHLILVMLFLISKFVYVIALVITFPSSQTNDHSLLDLKVVVCHVSGTIACELLLLLLVSPILWFVINVSTLILVLAIFMCCNSLMKLLINHGTTQINGDHGQSHETINVEAEITSTL